MHSKVVIAALVVSAGTAAADVCEQWHGPSIVEGKISTVGALVVERTADPEALTAFTLGEPSTSRKLSNGASQFTLVGSPSAHLLVTSDSLQGAITGQRLSPKGEPIGAPITIVPAAMRDQQIEAVLYDDRDWIVIVQFGSFNTAEFALFVISTTGEIRRGPEPFVITSDARVFPGPTPGTLWIVEHSNPAARGHVRAFVRGEDGVAGPVVDLGLRTMTGAATGASGELLVLHHAPDNDDLAASLVTPDGRSSTIPTGASGFWQPTARPDGSFLAISAANDAIDGFVLDAAGAPVVAPHRLTRGKLRGVSTTHIIWTQTIESTDVRTNQLVTMEVSGNGSPGAARPLASHRQERETYECTNGCTGNDAGGGGAGPLMLLLVLCACRVRARRALRSAP